jgi:hypothetical protein
MYWPAVDCIGGRESSLALAAATRVPANINIWNNRTVLIVSLDLSRIFDAVSALAVSPPLLKEQIAELRPPALIQRDNLAIEYGFPSEGQSQSPAKIRERVVGISVAGNELSVTVLDDSE